MACVIMYNKHCKIVTDIDTLHCGYSMFRAIHCIVDIVCSGLSTKAVLFVLPELVLEISIWFHAFFKVANATFYEWSCRSVGLSVGRSVPTFKNLGDNGIMG